MRLKRPPWLPCADLHFVLTLVFLCLSVVYSQAQSVVRGRVKDSSGSPIAAARVTLKSRNFHQSQNTDNSGRFQFFVPAGSGTITAEAAGYSAAKAQWTSGTTEVALVLRVLAAREQVTVTATRSQTPAASSPSVTTVTGLEVREAGAVTLDDALRQVLGFTLFRRSGSATSNPTTLGVSLRGVGASGASRALVLNDGIPLNDPFGGWIYWGRVPQETIDRVEVVRGGASNLYGTDALGGVINVLSLTPTDTSLTIESSIGNLGTPIESATGSLRSGNWIGTLSGKAFHTNGYVNIPKELRGAVDTVTNADYQTGTARVERSFGDRARSYLEGSDYTESRQNGKLNERNSANIRQLKLGADLHSDPAGDFSLRIFGGTEGLRQNFFAVSPDRNSENLTREQSVPVWQLGVSGVWSRQFKRNHAVAGIDSRWVDGESNETLYLEDVPGSLVRAGGRQHTTGLFAEDLLQLGSRLLLAMSARVDHWANLDGHSLSRALSAAGVENSIAFPDRDESAFSPRLGTIYHLSRKISLNSSIGRSFRAPTLNELYRNFRVGSVLTLANADLRAERLTGAEIGAVTNINDHLDIRTTYFWNRIDGPVANVTLSNGTALITRMRQNLGETRSRGLEVDGEYIVRNNLAFRAGYQFANAAVVRAPGIPALVGLQIPQVPRHEFTFSTRYSNAKLLTAAIQGRFQGRQFDDDQNQLPLKSFFTLDAFLSRQVGTRAELFISAENLLDNRYEIGRTPVLTIGAPTMARAGIRLHFGGK